MSVAPVPCRVCGEAAPVFHVFPRRALLTKPVAEPLPEATADLALGYCPDCRHVSGAYDSPLAGDLLERTYTELYAHHSPTSLSPTQVAWDHHVAGWLSRRLPPDARVLEVGCFDGLFLALLRDRGCAVRGVEPSPAVETARSRGLDVVEGFFDPDAFEAGAYDLVVLRHVVEHVPEPGALLSPLAGLLRPGGVVYVEVPNSLYSLEERYYPEFHVDHLSYFTAASLATTLARSGLGRVQHLESVRAYLRFPFLTCLAAPGEAPSGGGGWFQDFAIEATLARFGESFAVYCDSLRRLVAGGRVGVWGTGMLGGQLAIDGGWAESDAWYVDPNEVNQRLRLSVTGHVVHAPATLDDVEVSSVVVASGWEEDALAQLSAATRRRRPVHVFTDLLRGQLA